jgi:hypothetical protein
VSRSCQNPGKLDAVQIIGPEAVSPEILANADGNTLIVLEVLFTRLFESLTVNVITWVPGLNEEYNNFASFPNDPSRFEVQV